MTKLFTSESVTEGHPDKVCDQVADAILDEILKEDPDARCAIECCAAYNRMMIMGEVTTTLDIKKSDYKAIARRTVKDIGYTEGSFAYNKFKIKVAVHKQSEDIARGVDSSDYLKVGAGDQGQMFGYACRDTEELMPLPIMLSHRLAKALADARKSGALPYLRPDGKTQVTVQYEDKKPVRIDAVVMSAQHEKGMDQKRLKKDLMELIAKTLPGDLLDDKTKYFINPTGVFEIGGPEGDSGLTGRKIIVDTYGGRCRHGGGSFSGKDWTKVDRSGAYMARYICKNLVAAGICDEVEMQLAFAIGVPEPVSVFVDTFGTGKLSDEEITEIVKREFDLCPGAIAKTLDLKKPLYRSTAVYGHFGKGFLPWERTDRVEDLKKYL